MFLFLFFVSAWRRSNNNILYIIIFLGQAFIVLGKAMCGRSQNIHVARLPHIIAMAHCLYTYYTYTQHIEVGTSEQSTTKTTTRTLRCKRSKNMIVWPGEEEGMICLCVVVVDVVVFLFFSFFVFFCSITIMNL